MVWYKSEEEVDEIIKNMVERTKGSHITQSVSFNKKSPQQMRWLKLALMSSPSFGGLMKEMLNERFAGVEVETVNFEQKSKSANIKSSASVPNTNNVKENVVKNKKVTVIRNESNIVSDSIVNVGNFL